MDTDRWVSSRVDELASRMGLDVLNLSHDEMRAILTKIVDLLRGDASTINIDTIVRRFHRNLEHLMPIIAAHILELREKLDESLLEFVVNNIGDNVVAYAPRLYRECVDRGRHDLLDRLRAAWAQAWVKIRGPPLPVKCPRCSFDSLMPDLSCLVCGSIVTEEELKKYINFDELLKDFALTATPDEVKTAINYGYVLLTSLGLKAPNAERHPLDIEIVLTSREKSLLKQLLTRRESNG